MTFRSTIAVSIQNLSKSYGGLRANDQVSFDVEAGTIHSIVGENGAGKSTAMKQLFGLVQPDAGKILIYGQEVRIRNPKDAKALGIGMVHQHFRLSQTHTALENVLLSEAPGPFKILNRKKILQELKALSEQTGLYVDWEKKVEDLPVGVQQRIEILKVLRQKSEILILDEPTAVLTPLEVDELFLKLRSLVKDFGKTVLIVTHKLREVLEFTDKVTVIRHGKSIATCSTQGLNVQKLAEWMVGRSVHQWEAPPVLSESLSKGAEPVLRVRDLSGPLLKNINFQVNPYEIVGVAGVEGNGQSDLIQAILFPNDPRFCTSGKVFRPARGEAFGVIPEDRHREALLMDETLKDNFLLGFESSSRFQRYGFLNEAKIEAYAQKTFEDWDVRPRSLNAIVRGLSGGNQQKLIIGRECQGQPKLLIAAQPTRGVDIGAIERIHQKLLDLRACGCGVLLISSELDEILALSDRILVFYRGRIIMEQKRSETTREKVGMALGGVVLEKEGLS